MSNHHPSLLQTHILDPETFLKAILSGQPKGQRACLQAIPWRKVTIRPVLLRDKYHLQFSYFDGRQDITKNYPLDQVQAELDQLFALPFTNIQVETTAGTWRVQVTKKGKTILHREKPTETSPASDRSHDRAKNLLLADDQVNPFLEAIGLMTSEGKVRANRRHKFQQINQFLKLLDQTANLQTFLKQTETIRVIDCGCGSAHLSFAVYHYLRLMRGCLTTMVGVDLKQRLLQERIALAQSLNWSDLTFVHSPIADYQPAWKPDITLALHACDTATDEALAQAIAWDSQFIFSVPCCHHHLQTQLASVGHVEDQAQKPLLRHGLLKERFGDILTDAFRALILRMKGYRTDVIEFVSSEHTDKNLLIRAVKTAPAGAPQFEQEYLALKAAWGVTPYLESLLRQT